MPSSSHWLEAFDDGTYVLTDTQLRASFAELRWTVAAATSYHLISSLDVTGRGKRILIVDDNPVVIGAAKRALVHAGYEVESRGSVAEIDAHGADGFDLILMDVVMPELFGDDVAAILRHERGVGGRIVSVLDARRGRAPTARDRREGRRLHREGPRHEAPRRRGRAHSRYVDMIASGIDADATTIHSVTPTMNGREPTFASAAGDNASPIRNSASTSARRPSAAVGFA